MSPTREQSLNRINADTQSRTGFVARNRTLLYAVAAFLVLMGALFGGDGRHPVLSAFIAGLGVGIALTTARFSRR